MGCVGFRASLGSSRLQPLPPSLVCSQFPFPCWVACRIPSCFRLSILSHFACQQQQTRPKLSFSFLGGHRFLLTPFFSFLILAFEICQERVWGLMKTPPPNRLKDAGKCLWSQCQFLPCKGRVIPDNQLI